HTVYFTVTVGSCGGNERVIQSQVMVFFYQKLVSNKVLLHLMRCVNTQVMPSCKRRKKIGRADLSDKHWREPQANSMNGVNFNRLIKRCH
ncbi:hypothetical protein T01_13878, partial [Trichinella spiralis]